MRLSPFLALPLFLTLASIARAEEPKSYALDVKPVFQVGEVLTSTAHEENNQERIITTADGTAQPTPAEHETLEYTATRKVLEVDSAGRVTKELVHFSTWKHVTGDETASELAGAHVQVTGRGPSRTWKLLTPGVTPSEATKAWLEKTYGADEKADFGEAIQPAKAVAVGETWDIDVAKLSPAMGKELAFDAAKSSAKGTLVKVDDDHATIHLEMSLQVKSIAAGHGMTLTVLEGGIFSMTGEDNAPLAARSRGEGGSMTLKFDVKTDLPQGMTMAMKITGTQQSTTKAGGDMPEIPAAKAAAGEQPPGK